MRQYLKTKKAGNFVLPPRTKRKFKSKQTTKNYIKKVFKANEEAIGKAGFSESTFVNRTMEMIGKEDMTINDALRTMSHTRAFESLEEQTKDIFRKTVGKRVDEELTQTLRVEWGDKLGRIKWSNVEWDEESKSYRYKLGKNEKGETIYSSTSVKWKKETRKDYLKKSRFEIK